MTQEAKHTKINIKLKIVYLLDIYPIRNDGGEMKKKELKQTGTNAILSTRKSFPLSLHWMRGLD